MFRRNQDDYEAMNDARALPSPADAESEEITAVPTGCYAGDALDVASSLLNELVHASRCGAKWVSRKALTDDLADLAEKHLTLGAHRPFIREPMHEIGLGLFQDWEAAKGLRKRGRLAELEKDEHTLPNPEEDGAPSWVNSGRYLYRRMRKRWVLVAKSVFKTEAWRRHFGLTREACGYADRHNADFDSISKCYEDGKWDRYKGLDLATEKAMREAAGMVTVPLPHDGVRWDRHDDPDKHRRAPAFIAVRVTNVDEDGKIEGARVMIGDDVMLSPFQIHGLSRQLARLGMTSNVTASGTADYTPPQVRNYSDEEEPDE